MPTPRERAWTVVDRWQAGVQVSLPTEKLVGLAEMITAAIDAQVADWMASHPVRVLANPEAVALASETVEHEPGKDYAKPNGDHVLARSNGTIAVSLPPMSPPCLHTVTKWDSQNQFLVCTGCKEEFRKGTCIRCGRPAKHEEGFSCGERCA